MLEPIRTALELGFITALTVFSLFLSYSMLNVCDLSTDGCFTLGAAVGAVVAIAGHPWLSLIAAPLAGVASGFLVAFLQTRMGVDSLLAGIIVNTGLYSVNIAVMGGSSQLNLNKVTTVFTLARDAVKGTPLLDWSKLIVVVLFMVAVAALLALFLRTRMGLAIRATGNNPDMVRSSSINPKMTTTVGLCVSGAMTALSGCLMAQAQKSAEINMGTGMVTIALASLLIGGIFSLRTKHIPVKLIGAALGAFLFRLVYTAALRIPWVSAYMIKGMSAIIVILAIFIPYLKKQYPQIVRRIRSKQRGEVPEC